LGQVRQLADHYGVGIHIHLAETPSETDTVRARFGTTPTQALDQLVGLGPDVLCAHCIELTDDDIETLAASRAGVAHCATSNMKLGNGVARILLAAGAVVGLGTDSIMTNNNLDPFEEMRTASLLQKQAWRDPEVMTAADVLQLATLGSARALGLATEIGSIEVGKRADLIVVGFDEPRSWPLLTSGRPNVIEQLVWSCSGSDVRHTVVDGQVLMEHRQLLTLDLDEIRELVGVEARHLLGRAGLLADDGIGSTDA
jgi:5-methylthioadenosine/S-adenosylhomocysteine deaminase